jgi:hypothetical protein
MGLISKRLTNLKQIVMAKIDEVDINQPQIIASAETLREISANLILAIIVTILFDRNPYYFNRLLGLLLALCIWYTSIMIYKKVNK